MMDMIRADLALLGIHHDLFSSEAAVQSAGRVDAAFARASATVVTSFVSGPEAMTERSSPTTPPALSQEARDAITREFPSDIRDLFHESPNPCVNVPEHGLWKVFLSTLYAPTDIVWMGTKFDSGEPRHARNFRTVGEWVDGDPVGHLTSLSTFKLGSFSRGLSSVDKPKYFVVESDTVPISQQGTAIRFCRQFAELGAIVHSGNKSLHAWFRRPSDPVVMAELQRIMPQLGADPTGLTNAAQPFRLPGFRREGSDRYTGLLWLAGGPV